MSSTIFDKDIKNIYKLTNDELLIIQEGIENNDNSVFRTKYLCINLENVKKSVIEEKKIYSNWKLDNIIKLSPQDSFSSKYFYENNNENGIIFSQR